MKKRFKSACLNVLIWPMQISGNGTELCNLGPEPRRAKASAAVKCVMAWTKVNAGF